MRWFSTAMAIGMISSLALGATTTPPTTRPDEGRQKIFEVRKLYNDITFIDEFFTLEFCVEQKFYMFGFQERSGSWEIMSREFKKVKDQLLRMLTNRGLFSLGLSLSILLGVW